MIDKKFMNDSQWLNTLGYQDNDGRDLKIVKSCIRIKELDRVYRFWHFSDVHISFAFPNNEEFEIEQAIERNQFWSRVGGQNGLYVLDKLIEAANKEELDGVFICGDLIDYYSESNMLYLHEKLSKLHTKLFYALGNHEGYNGEGAVDARRFYKDYDLFTNGETGSRIVDFGKFLVLVIDDSDLKIRREQIEALEKANIYKKPIILVVHIPVITDGLEPSCMERWGTSFMLGTEDDVPLSKEFVKQVKAADSNVVAICAGHIHYTNVSEFSAGKFQYCNEPALTGFVREIEICPE